MHQNCDMSTAEPSSEGGRTTISLSRKGLTALKSIQKRDGVKIAVAVNRALELLDFLDTEKAKGKTVYLHNDEEGTAAQITWL